MPQVAPKTFKSYSISFPDGKVQHVGSSIDLAEELANDIEAHILEHTYTLTRTDELLPVTAEEER